VIGSLPEPFLDRVVCGSLVARDQGRDAEEVPVPGSVEGFEIGDLSVLLHIPIDPQAARLV
jgi:hypothetical protein